MKGENFRNTNKEPLFCEGNYLAIVIFLYGRNVAGESTNLYSKTDGVNKSDKMKALFNSL